MRYNGITAFFMIMPVLILLSCRESGREQTDNNSTDEINTLMIYTGSYAGKDEPGIRLLEYDMSTGEFIILQEVAGHLNPSFLAIDAGAGFLFAVNETADYDDNNSGSVTAFSIDKESGKLSFINRRSSLGAHPCHIKLMTDKKHVAVANYSGGSIAVLPVAKDGSLQEATGFIQHYGSGPDARRQSAPHAHSVYPHDDGTWVFTADLGIDKVMAYRIDNEGYLTLPPESSPAEMEPGAGPRHLAIHTSGNWIYVVNELNSTVTRLRFDNISGELTVMETVSTLPVGYNQENYCADIRIHPGGKYLYASNRGHNSIAIFELGQEGEPVILGHEPVRGEWPRNFNIDPSGMLLFVANQNSNNITVFDIDQKTGLLSFTGTELEIPRPVCIQFFNR